MSKRPFFIRKWTDGERAVTKKEKLGANTFDHILLPNILAEVDEAAADRYRKQVTNETLQLFRVVKNAEAGGEYGIYYVRFTEGSDFPNHSHQRSQASIMIIEGTGHVILDGQRFPIGAGDVVHIPPGTAHEFFVAQQGSALAYIAVTQPDVVFDRDKVERSDIDWHPEPSNRYTPEGDIRDI